MTDTSKDPEYLLVETKNEIERLTKQHRWMSTCQKGQLIFVPVDLKSPTLKVLDVGTSDGTLLRDLSKQVSPDATLVGTDVMPSFIEAGRKTNAASGIKNLDFVLHDINTDFPPELQNTFDITHVRAVLASSAKTGLKAAVTRLASTLKPGGWLQVQEMDMDLENPALSPTSKDCLTLFKALFTMIGLGPRYYEALEELFREAGLEEVSVKKIELPMGKRLGDGPQVQESIEPFKFTIPTVIGATAQCNIPAAVTDNLVERFEKEMLETGGSFHFLMVTGRKPLGGQQ